MSHEGALRELQAEMRRELSENILPFWLERAVDRLNGGWLGMVDGQGRPESRAPKGAVLNARILWTFAAAFRTLGEERLRVAAERAATFFRAYFLDPARGGAYWLVTPAGSPKDARKYIYAQAFAIYGLSEYARATGDEASGAAARAIFTLVERHAPDPVHGGYREAFSRAWRPLADVRLSAVDAHEARSTNTHLHLLEAYTGLLRVWPDPRLSERTAELLELILEHMIDPALPRMYPFFDERWKPRSAVTSYGHDIEASWLLVEAARAVGDAGLTERVQAASVRLAGGVLAEGYDVAGGLYERGEGGVVTETDKEWWPQAEAIVGFLNAYELTGRDEFRMAALTTWAFVRDHVRDREHGEWHRRVARDGTPRTGHELVGPWKCPYHNARACLEVMERVERLVPPVPAR